MAGLLYYLPNAKTLGRAELEPLGLLPALGDGFRVAQVNERGPDGGGGLIVGSNKGIEDISVRNHPTRQTWQQVPGKQVWLGFYHDDRPRPADLIRKEPLAGHLVRLADENDWLVPVARGWQFDPQQPEASGPYIALPQAIGMGEDGSWAAGDPVAKYARLWKTACDWWDVRSGATEITEGEIAEGESQTTIEFDFAGGLDAAVDVLATNYRLGRFEVAVLGLFDNLSPGKILDAAIDCPTIAAWSEAESKKNTDSPAAADSSTDAGPPDSTADTDPPSPTSGH